MKYKFCINIVIVACSISLVLNLCRWMGGEEGNRNESVNLGMEQKL